MSAPFNKNVRQRMQELHSVVERFSPTHAKVSNSAKAALNDAMIHLVHAAMLMAQEATAAPALHPHAAPPRPVGAPDHAMPKLPDAVEDVRQGEAEITSVSLILMPEAQRIYDRLTAEDKVRWDKWAVENLSMALHFLGCLGITHDGPITHDQYEAVLDSGVPAHARGADFRPLTDEERDVYNRLEEGDKSALRQIMEEYPAEGVDILNDLKAVLGERINHATFEIIVQSHRPE